MTDPEGLPYCLPVTIVRDEDTVYFHCARDGFKVQCLRANPQVCLACVCDTHIIAEKFTTEFASAILRGTASEVTDDAEKIHALRLLCQRHTPAGMDGFDAAVAGSLRLPPLVRHAAEYRIDAAGLGAGLSPRYFNADDLGV